MDEQRSLAFLTRSLDGSNRVRTAIRQIDVKRLEYRESDDGPPDHPISTGYMRDLTAS